MKLTSFRLLHGFDCIFDLERDSSSYADFFEKCFDELPHSFFVGPSQARPSQPRHRGLLRHYLAKSERPARSYDILDADGPRELRRGGLHLFAEGTEAKSSRDWSCQRFFLPLTEPPGKLLEWVLHFLRAVPVRYGVGGLTLAPAATAYEGNNPQEAFQYCWRNRGAIFWSYASMQAKDGIRDSNWLTLVSQELLTKAGGIEAARKNLSEAVTIHSVREGWLFQAGERPLLGDMSKRADDFSAYVEVARFLRPCRDSKVLWGPYESPGEFTHEEMRQWIARFDGGVPYSVKMPEIPPPLKQPADIFTNFDKLAQAEVDWKAYGDFGAASNGIHPQIISNIVASARALLTIDPAFAKGFIPAMERAKERGPTPLPPGTVLPKRRLKKRT